MRLHKLKYSKVEKEHKFEDELYDHKTLMEIVLIADTTVTQSKRTTLMLLDMLGEIGGFFEAIFMVIGIFASSYAAKMFQKNIAKSYYTRKKNRKELDPLSISGNKYIHAELEEIFERIEPSYCVVMADAFVCTVLSPCKKCLSKKVPAFRR